LIDAARRLTWNPETMSEDTPLEAAPARRVRHALWQVVSILGTALSALLWLVLAGTDPTSWVIGAPSILAALWAKVRLSGEPIRRLSVPGAIRFLPYFLWESLKGGVDVALRVLGSRVRVNPGYIDYRLRLARPSARVLFMDLINLLPGTLTADVEGNRAKIHTLDLGGDHLRSLMDLEERVAALFGETLVAPRSARP
jgi:multicomponent Na+:H+ antiporter subunit E